MIISCITCLQRISSNYFRQHYIPQRTVQAVYVNVREIFIAFYYYQVHTPFNMNVEVVASDIFEV